MLLSPASAQRRPTHRGGRAPHPRLGGRHRQSSTTPVRTTRSTLRDRWPTLPIELGLAENVKGDRFRRTSRPSARPRGRWFCNVVLSSLTKVASGYWHVFDPLCGFRRAERDKGFGDGSRTRDIQLGRPRPLRGVAHLVEGRAFRVQLSCRGQNASRPRLGLTAIVQPGESIRERDCHRSRRPTHMTIAVTERRHFRHSAT